MPVSALALLLALPLDAQVARPAALRPATDAGIGDSVSLTRPSAAAGAGRFGLSVLAGAFAGYGSLYALFAINQSKCGDGCGISADDAMVVVGVATVAGTALGAALPKLGVPCSTGRRVGHAVAGAVAGGGLGALLGTSSRGMQYLGAYAGATVGSSFAVHGCRPKGFKP
jgi:hypothetical protein